VSGLDKNKLFKRLKAVFCVLLGITAVLVLFISSPLHPKNITAKTVAEKGVKYTVKLKGIHEYDEKGFSVATDGFFYTGDKAFVYQDDDGYARTTFDEQGEVYILGEYNSADILYKNYTFSGESYKNQKELEAFFETPDRIYDFDINKLSGYIQDVMTFEKKFTGKATVSIYRGRCVFTGIYIGDELVLMLK